jgi:hypothetical protein
MMAVTATQREVLAAAKSPDDSDAYWSAEDLADKLNHRRTVEGIKRTADALALHGLFAKARFGGHPAYCLTADGRDYLEGGK